MMGGGLSLGSTLARGCRALTRRLAVCSFKFRSAFKTCPEVFGEGESASEEPEALVDSPEMGLVSVGEDPLGVVGVGDVVQNPRLRCPYNGKKAKHPPPFKRQGIVTVGNGRNHADRSFGENDKNSQTFHFYSSGQSDRPPSSRPEADLLKQPTRNTRHFRTP